MLDAWFDKELPGDPMDHHINGLLEHTMRDNRSLLAKAEGRSGKPVKLTTEEFERQILQSPCQDSTAGDRSDLIAFRGSQSGMQKSRLQGLRRELRDQLEACLYQLDLLRLEEEELHQSVTAVASLLELDVYQYIYCIAQLTKRSAGELSRW
jgi:hypothetical protein